MGGGPGAHLGERARCVLCECTSGVYCVRAYGRARGMRRFCRLPRGTRRFQKVPKDLLLTPNYPEVATLETTWSSNLIFVSIQPR